MSNISKYFTREEFACKCKCGFDAVDTELLHVLEDIREYFNKPLYISSACRCISHNHAVGGRPSSQHRIGKAADITVKDIPPSYVQDYLIKKYDDKYGIGKYTTFTHIDVRAYKARW